jgi:hypothetical protein
MRIAIWATTSVIALLAALWLVLSNAPAVGGGSIPYTTFIPRGGEVLFCVGLLLVIAGIVLVIVGASKRIWIVYAVASALPLLLSFWPASYDFRAARFDSVHPWEGSDAGGHMAAANVSLLIGLIFTLMLVNVSVVGCRRGRSKDLTNR